MKTKTKNKKISLLMLSDTGAHNISFALSVWVVKLLVTLFMLVICAMALFVAYYARISHRILTVSVLARENTDLKEKNRKIDNLYAEIRKIKAYEKKIRLLTMNDEGNAETLTDGSASFFDYPEVVPEKELDLFVQNIKLQRNLAYINIKDGEERRKRIIESAPTILPVDGWISRGFEGKSDKGGRDDHTGIDIAAVYDSPIRASGPGIVTFAGWKPDFGNIVEIDHGYGYVSRYGHCSRTTVKKGDLVERSQAIAFVGSSGRSSAPHLHFEIIKDGQRIDPMLFIIK